MQCWCLSSNVLYLTEERLRQHMRKMTAEELMAHGDIFSSEYMQWYWRRGFGVPFYPTTMAVGLDPDLLLPTLFDGELWDHKVRDAHKKMNVSTEQLQLHHLDKFQLFKCVKGTSRMMANLRWSKRVRQSWAATCPVRASFTHIPEVIWEVVYEFTGDTQAQILD